jgi:hypothetical protein
MKECEFEPPLTLKGDAVMRTLADALRFVRRYGQARRPPMRDSVLHRLERADSETEQRDAISAFRGWAEAENLILNSGDTARGRSMFKVYIGRVSLESRDDKSLCYGVMAINQIEAETFLQCLFVDYLTRTVKLRRASPGEVASLNLTHEGEVRLFH